MIIGLVVFSLTSVLDCGVRFVLDRAMKRWGRSDSHNEWITWGRQASTELDRFRVASRGAVGLVNKRQKHNCRR